MVRLNVAFRKCPSQLKVVVVIYETVLKFIEPYGAKTEHEPPI